VSSFIAGFEWVLPGSLDHSTRRSLAPLNRGALALAFRSSVYPPTKVALRVVTLVNCAHHSWAAAVHLTTEIPAIGSR